VRRDISIAARARRLPSTRSTRNAAPCDYFSMVSAFIFLFSCSHGHPYCCAMHIKTTIDAWKEQIPHLADV
jgi:hypothetical protein